MKLGVGLISTMRQIVQIAGICLALTLTSCDRSEIYRHVLYQMPEEASLADMVDLTIFGSFTPGLTFQSAEQQFGKPAFTETGNNGYEYRGYITNGLRIAVAKEVQVSGGIPGDRQSLRLEWWTIYAFPTNSSAGIDPQLFFKPAVKDRLKNETPPYVINLRSKREDAEAWCTIESRGITRIRWFTPASRTKK